MNWETLLSPTRLCKEPKPQQDGHRSAFQQDFDRIVFSSAFRRMQDKTQVFPLAENDYVRTRLTHSLEAACVGRSLGTSVGAYVTKRHRPEGIHPSDIGDIVAAASLAHDIGNPPFGHSGEDGIRHWFTHSEVAREIRGQLEERERDDFARFEGNAQGFRIVTCLQMPDNEGGLQLTCATLAAFAKYPLASDTPEALRQGAGAKKFSFFLSETEFFAEVAERTGMIRKSADAACWARHPLAFLVEAADDICYTLVDFEDGLQLGLLSYEEISEAFARVIGDEGAGSLAFAQKGMQSDKERAQFLRAKAIGASVAQVAAAFEQHEAEILAGEFDQPLLDCTAAGTTIREIKKRSRESIYISRQGVEIEAAGFEVVSGLLDRFGAAVEDYARLGGSPSPRSRTLLRLIPPQFITPELARTLTPYQRLQRITDFVSGMTDSYAVSLYRKLLGITLPGQR